MQKENTVVLSTSDIFTIGFRPHPELPKRRVLGHADVEALWSTGVLEAALEQGLRPVVVSTRVKFGTHDAWWLTLVEEAGGKVLKHEEKWADKMVKAYEATCDADIRNVRVSSVWMRAFHYLGVEWPTMKIGEEVLPQFWASARRKLTEVGFHDRATVTKAVVGG